MGEGLDDLLLVPVAVQMVVVDVVDQGHRGHQGEKAADVLAGLGDEQVPVPHLHAPVQQVHEAAHVDRGVQLRLLVDVGQHGGDGGLAVAAGDGGHMGVPGGDLAEGHAPLHLGDAVLPGVGPLRVVGLDGGGVDDQLRTRRLLPLLGDADGDAQLHEPVRELGPLPVRARDLMALLLQYLRDTAHAAPAHADEMDALHIVQTNCHFPCLQPTFPIVYAFTTDLTTIRPLSPAPWPSAHRGRPAP